VIASAGKTLKVDGLELDWTLGENTVDCFIDKSNILTMGFHQSNVVNESVLVEKNEIGFSVYPNPVTHKLNIDYNNDSEKILIKIYDLIGKTYLNDEYSPDGVIQIDTSNMPNNYYIIEITNNNNEKFIQNIIKY